MVNGPCTIMVVAIARHAVRLGIEADPAVTIHREEIAERIKKREEADRG
jgi:carbon storage regulator CsrA